MRPTALMLLSNAYVPDPRVRSEAMALRQAGYEVQIIGWDRDGQHPRTESIEGIRIRRVHLASLHGRGWTQLPFLWVFWLMASWHIVRCRCAIIHCHDLDTLPIGHLWAWLKRVPIVYDSHESYPDLMSGSLPSFFVWLIRVLERFYLKRVDLVITVGNKLARRLLDDGAPRVEVVGNWKDPEDFRFSVRERQKTKDSLGIPPGALVVSFIANLDQGRKVKELLAAVEDLDGVFLIVGGNGPAAELAAAQAEISRNTRYLGFVDPHEIPKYTAISDVIYYGFDTSNANADYSAPNKLFEALASGAAVLTGTFGEIGDIVQKHHVGIALRQFTCGTLRSALTYLRDDRQALSRMADGARKLGRTTYNLARAKARLVEAYAQLVPLASPGVSTAVSRSSNHRLDKHS